jgi:hypothetical protein
VKIAATEILEMASTGKRPPLRYQISEYDCVPTTIGNAIAYLFDRDEIPPEVIQRIYLYTLDAAGRRGTFARGSSEESVRLLAGWLEQFSSGAFRIRTEFLAGREVHLRRGNRIVECLNDGGVALCSITYDHGDWHYVLALRSDGRRLYFFDPYWRREVRGSGGRVKVIRPPGPDGANLSIEREWLDTASNRRRFCFGTWRNRDCLLMRRRR